MVGNIILVCCVVLVRWVLWMMVKLCGKFSSFWFIGLRWLRKVVGVLVRFVYLVVLLCGSRFSVVSLVLLVVVVMVSIFVLVWFVSLFICVVRLLVLLFSMLVFSMLVFRMIIGFLVFFSSFSVVCSLLVLGCNSWVIVLWLLDVV